MTEDVVDEQGKPYSWSCVICSQTCKQLGIIGSSIYNIELENESGKYGEAVVTPVPDAPKQWATVLIWRYGNKLPETIYPLCRTCYDMCECIAHPDPEAIGNRGPEIAAYFELARTKEYIDYIQTKDKKGGLGTV